MPLQLAATSLAKSHVLSQLHQATGNDFTRYKQSSVDRRLQRRMMILGLKSIEDYADFVDKNPAELPQLMKELLINVTQFFRDPALFELLATEIFPALCQRINTQTEFKIWIAGCASGEEAYSIAMVLREWMDYQPTLKIHIFASDLDEDAIATAQAGHYSAAITSDVSPTRLQRFFTAEKCGYRVKPELREMVTFATQNAFDYSPAQNLDLISCRNLMIYLGSALQTKLLLLFHAALKHDGVLILSPSESVGKQASLFAPFHRKLKIYLANGFPPTSAPR